MSIKHKLRMLLLYLPLLAGSLSGVPMRPEDMDQLMEAMNQERIEYVIPDDSENGDESIKEIKKLVEGRVKGPREIESALRTRGYLP